ncbi:GIY-YIG nuclease family protein [[Limnothrix rosea] IAM M-220]|uniref:GIY-YIG nuclease family protein n=1 Tax=[Limnothrix rosea] IAM M-220 TaxID=454133 RepID=UPI00095A07AB|nr:GIY-YIG nuclease family protein [[Limnothrix rosea] IAM M-220]OKH17573.1 hypothetical protein NIES208_08660 [[Limnothrix rosea] IAM M-220]
MAKPKLTTDDDLALLSELGVDLDPKPIPERTPREQRIIAGFEEIEHFVEEQGRLPHHSGEDIFERIYATRLEAIRKSEECRTLLEPLDTHHLLDADAALESFSTTELSDEELLASLGVEVDSESDLTELKHVRSRQEIQAAEEIAKRTPCKDFKQFKPIFEEIQQDLNTGARKTVKYQDNATINQGDLFILDGQKILVAEKGELFTTDYGLMNARLRVIYDNGTENDFLLRSFQRALNKDKTSRRITSFDLGPLFSQTEESASDVPTGYIYVLRSHSEDPYIVQNRDIIHKIGVTNGDVKKRIANAKKESTYLLADVEIVQVFTLTNVHAKKLEALLHKFFEAARLQVKIQDRFGNPVQPKEWFLVPLSVIETVIEKIQLGTLDQFFYDVSTANLKMKM